MSRSGYSDDYDDDWELICWRGAVASAINGKRGQAFLREMLIALDALPAPCLIEGELDEQGEVCAIGSVGKARGIDMQEIDAYDTEEIAETFGIARALAAEIAFVNDECGRHEETPEQRFIRVRRWVAEQIPDAERRAERSR